MKFITEEIDNELDRIVKINHEITDLAEAM